MDNIEKNIIKQKFEDFFQNFQFNPDFFSKEKLLEIKKERESNEKIKSNKKHPYTWPPKKPFIKKSIPKKRPKSVNDTATDADDDTDTDDARSIALDDVEVDGFYIGALWDEFLTYTYSESSYTKTRPTMQISGDTIYFTFTNEIVSVSLNYEKNNYIEIGAYSYQETGNPHVFTGLLGENWWQAFSAYQVYLGGIRLNKDYDGTCESIGGYFDIYLTSISMDTPKISDLSSNVLPTGTGDYGILYTINFLIDVGQVTAMINIQAAQFSMGINPIFTLQHTNTDNGKTEFYEPIDSCGAYINNTGAVTPSGTFGSSSNPCTLSWAIYTSPKYMPSEYTSSTSTYSITPISFYNANSLGAVFYMVMTSYNIQPLSSNNNGSTINLATINVCYKVPITDEAITISVNMPQSLNNDADSYINEYCDIYFDDLNTHLNDSLFGHDLIFEVTISAEPSETVKERLKSYYDKNTSNVNTHYQTDDITYKPKLNDMSIIVDAQNMKSSTVYNINDMFKDKYKDKLKKVSDDLSVNFIINTIIKDPEMLKTIYEMA